jgi:hypothetical protein
VSSFLQPVMPSRRVYTFISTRKFPARLAALIAAGMLDIGKVRVRHFPFSELDAAIGAAAGMRRLDLTVLTIGWCRSGSRPCTARRTLSFHGCAA